MMTEFILTSQHHILRKRVSWIYSTERLCVFLEKQEYFQGIPP